MKLLLMSFLLLSSLAVNAQDADCDETTPKEVKTAMRAVKMVDKTICIEEKKLKHLCMFIDTKSLDKTPGTPLKYRYQRHVMDAACVDVQKDSEEVIAKKVSAMWKHYEGSFKCNNLSFEVRNGNIIKYASVLLFDGFLDDVIRWKVDLNVVDETDGRTVLDFISYQIEKNKGLPIADTYQFYYKKLKKAGAKHKSEL